MTRWSRPTATAAAGVDAPPPPVTLLARGPRPRPASSTTMQGLQAEARTYNTVISACSKAGQFDRALRVYQHMRASGVEPSTTTYTAMIGVFSRLGQLDKCLEVYHVSGALTSFLPLL